MTLLVAASGCIATCATIPRSCPAVGGKVRAASASIHGDGVRTHTHSSFKVYALGWVDKLVAAAPSVTTGPAPLTLLL